MPCVKARRRVSIVQRNSINLLLYIIQNIVIQNLYYYLDHNLQFYYRQPLPEEMVVTGQAIA